MEKDNKMLTQAWRIQPEQLTQDTMVGQGAFGAVWKGTLSGSLCVAVKVVAPAQGKKMTLDHDSEIRFLMRTRDPHLVLFMGCGINTDGSLFLVTEFCEGGSLDTTLWGREPLPWQQRVDYLSDICQGIRYLHVIHQSVHRDIKSPNCLIKARPPAQCLSTRSTWMIKLGDFGLSKIVTRGKRRLRKMSKSVSMRRSPLPTAKPVKKHRGSAASGRWDCKWSDTMVGTPAWMAPELLSGNHRYGPAVDIFAFGVVMWEVLTSQRPWQGVSQDKLMELVKGGNRLVIPRNMSGPSEYVLLMQSCWEAKPASRPGISDVTNAVFKISDDMAFKTGSASAPGIDDEQGHNAVDRKLEPHGLSFATGKVPRHGLAIGGEGPSQNSINQPSAQGIELNSV